MRLKAAALILALCGAADSWADVRTEIRCQSALGDLIYVDEHVASGECIGAIRDDERNATWSTTAYADKGVQKLVASANSYGVDVYTFSRAFVADDLTLMPVDPSLIGRGAAIYFQAPSLTVSTFGEAHMPLPPEVYADGNGFTEVHASFTYSMYSNAMGYAQGQRVSTVQRVGADVFEVSREEGPPLQDFVWGVTIGDPFDLHIYVDAISAVQDPLTHGPVGVATVNAGNSAYWGGVSRVVLDDGTTFDYSLTSSSGFDWGKSYIPNISAPVPEPAPILMGLIGMAALVARRLQLRT
jgi:hypothetical protein